MPLALQDKPGADTRQGKPSLSNASFRWTQQQALHPLIGTGTLYLSAANRASPSLRQLDKAKHTLRSDLQASTRKPDNRRTHLLIPTLFINSDFVLYVLYNLNLVLQRSRWRRQLSFLGVVRGSRGESRPPPLGHLRYGKEVPSR